jgi:hypothetical protein
MIAASFRTSARAEHYGVLVAGAECVSSACSYQVRRNALAPRSLLLASFAP